MSPTPVRGRAVTEAEQGEAAKFTTKLGDANVAERGFSVGDGTHGTTVGKQDAVYSVYRTKVGDSTNIEVAHNLGRVPKVINLVSQEATPQATANSVVTVTLVNRAQWTSSTFRISLLVGVGAVDNILLTFQVG